MLSLSIVSMGSFCSRQQPLNEVDAEENIQVTFRHYQNQLFKSDVHLNLE